MRAMKLTGVRQMEMMEVPDPVITNDTDVLIKMTVVGVCGSDVHYYKTGRIGNQVVEYPFAVGHECAGEVLETGTAVTRVKPGDRIAIDPAMPCFECDQCEAGRTHTCRNLKFLGCPGQAEGCLSEYLVMPETSCYPIGAGMSADQAALSEPLSIGIYAVRQAAPAKEDKIAILGIGPIGQSVLAYMVAQKSENIYVTDKIDDRLKLAAQNSATWTGNPDKINVVKEIQKEEPLLLDIVFECCGQQEAINQAVDLLKPGGKLMIIGIPEFDRWSFPVDKLRHKEISIHNVRRQNDSVQYTINLMVANRIRVDNWITHRYPFEDTQQAFELVADYKDGVLKAMIDFV